MTTLPPSEPDNSRAKIISGPGEGGLNRLKIRTPWSHAEIYLHGAHVTQFQKTGEPPVLFLSKRSRYEAQTPIRGGIPIIYPWFGNREGFPSHGFARTQTWTLRTLRRAPTGEAVLTFVLPHPATAEKIPEHTVTYTVTIGQTLTAELAVQNLSSQETLTFENCLHTYFNIGAIDAITIIGLAGAEYLDKTDHFNRKTEQSDPLKIVGETDRTYLNTTSAVEICDYNIRRRIRIEKTGSKSTVVWNPWAGKASQMSDLAREEFREMICVESGNISENRIHLPPGETHRLKVNLTTDSLV